MENVLITPHVAVADAEDIPERRSLEGRDFINVVDKAKWY